jgi:Tol biopolymer transport system component
MFAANRLGPIVLLALLASAASSEEAQWPHFAHPSWSPRGDRIAIDCGPGGKLDLCLYDVESDRVLRLTATTDMQEAVPVFSRDGSKLSFSREREGVWYLSVLDLATGEVEEIVELTSPYASSSSWSLDGERLAFDMLNERGDHDLFTVRLDGSDLRVLVEGPGSQRFATLSPDGSRLAYANIVEGAGDVMVADADGTNPRRVTTDPADEGVPIWSSDGTRLSFYSQRDGDFEVYTTDLQGGEVRHTHNPAFDIFAPFAPDGESLVFESNRTRDPGGFDRGADLFRLDLATGATTRLTEPTDFPAEVDAADLGWETPRPRDPDAHYLGRSDHPRWSPDGEWIVFDSTRDGNYEIYIMRADGSEQTRLTENPWQDLFPIFSSDGLRILFGSNRDGWAPEPRRSQIYSMALDGSDVRDLTRLGYDWHYPLKPAANHLEPFRLGADRIGFLSDRGGGWHEVYSMDEGGGDPTRITYDGTHHYNVFASPDGEWIYFDAHRGGSPTYIGDGGWDLHRIPASGGHWQDVTADPEHETYDGDVSPDGATLLFKRVGSVSVWRVEIGAGAEQATELIPEAFSPRWTPDGSRLAFVSERDGNREIYVAAADGSGQTRLTFSQ